MLNRIRKILMICSNYDAFTLEEDGRIEIQVTEEYRELNLSNPPKFIWANSSAEARKILDSDKEVDMIMCMYNERDKAVFSFASEIQSNASYLAVEKALEYVRNDIGKPVPLYLRNAPTKLMEDLGYSDGYKYAHDYPGHFVDLEFLPEGMEGTVFYEPAHNAHEDRLKAYLQSCWPKYYPSDQKG